MEGNPDDVAKDSGLYIVFRSRHSCGKHVLSFKPNLSESEAMRSSEFHYHNFDFVFIFLDNVSRSVPVSVRGQKAM